MPARFTHHLLSLVMILAASSLGANSLLFPRPSDCDPSKATCVHAPEKEPCEATNCFRTLSAQREHEEQNNCTFKCSDTITEISTAVLRQIFTSASITEERLAVIAAELNAALKNALVKGLIDTKRKLAHFLSQVKQEVGSSFQLTESLNYKPETLKEKFSYFAGHPDEAELYGRKYIWIDETKIVEGKIVKTKHKVLQPANQEAIANRAYANRNGNGDAASGDGWRYRGRGMIQLTGKSNYKTFTTQHSRIWSGDKQDFVTNPDLVAKEKYAVRSALIFWQNRGLDAIAQKGVTCTEADKITSKVNKGTDTYALRCENLKNIMKLPFFWECI